MTQTHLSIPQHLRAVLVLGLPLVGGHLAQFAIGLTDTVMLGWYGVEALAALTLASSWFFVIFLVGGGFAWAVMPLVAQFQAEDDPVQARRAARMGNWLSFAFAALAMPLFWWSQTFFLAMGQDPALAADAQSYLRIAGWGIFPALGVMVLKSFLAALERTQIVLWVTLMAAAVNGFLNWVFIFGNLGAPELGIAGAAIASLTTQIVSLMAVVVYVQLKMASYAVFHRFWRADGPMLTRVFQLGWPIGLTNLAEVGLFAGSAILMGWIGTVELAAHGIALQLASATFMVHLGLSNAATIRAGNALGRRDVEHLARGALVVTLLSAFVAAAAAIGFVLYPEVLIRLFVDADDPALPTILAVGSGLLAMAALFQLVDGAQAISLGLLRGLQDTRRPMIYAMIAYWGVGMPVSLILGFSAGLGAVGVWMGLVIGLVVAAALLGWRFWRVRLTELRAE